MEYTNKENFKKLDEIEKFRSRVLKYVIYKKRTEEEIRRKFEDADADMLDDTIQYFKEQNYINDDIYIKRAIDEFIALKNLSLKEVKYKLMQKGINEHQVDDYICKNKEEMLQYEISSCMNIINKKKQKMDNDALKNYLYSKGYMSESISIAFDELS